MTAVCPECASQGIVGKRSKTRNVITAVGAGLGALGGILSAVSSSREHESSNPGELVAEAICSAVMASAAGAAAGSAIGETLDRAPPHGIRCEVCGREVEPAHQAP